MNGACAWATPIIIRNRVGLKPSPASGCRCAAVVHVPMCRGGEATGGADWLGRWILHSATQFHPFSTLPWDDQYPLHHRAIDQSLREGKNSPQNRPQFGLK